MAGEGGGVERGSWGKTTLIEDFPNYYLAPGPNATSPNTSSGMTQFSKGHPNIQGKKTQDKHVGNTMRETRLLPQSLFFQSSELKFNKSSVELWSEHTTFSSILIPN